MKEIETVAMAGEVTNKILEVMEEDTKIKDQEDMAEVINKTMERRV